jgi:hypothetical protein
MRIFICVALVLAGCDSDVPGSIPVVLNPAQRMCVEHVSLPELGAQFVPSERSLYVGERHPTDLSIYFGDSRTEVSWGWINHTPTGSEVDAVVQRIRRLQFLLEERCGIPRSAYTCRPANVPLGRCP